MENFLNSLPRSILVFTVLVLGVLAVYVLKPPHTICDTQKNNVQELMSGVLYPTKSKKRTFPPKIAAVKEKCQQGVSSGACYEYFSILKTLAREVMKSSTECAPEIYSMKEIRAELNEGLEKIALMAWGEQPPEPGVARFSWLQESELLLFCSLRDAFIRSQSNEAWSEFRRNTYKKFPGEKLAAKKDPNAIAVTRLMAPQKFSENDIWNRSIFSIRCENYR